ncbi:MAG: aminotransferase class V-fold PLP-dependent enzyme, partial [Selenomonadaceae bacterium]|nr:aminotransferase class V-fold PLP-dependent enzyme [Selenomonadaceae bacterium]
MSEKISFASDYEEGAHPAIIENLQRTNFLKTAGYGNDEFSESARAKIRKACNAPDAEIYFLVGGTQTNAVVIGALLKSFEGVIAADSGHISIHEAGAIELGGHKVLTIKNRAGKILADDVRAYVENFYADGNHEHMTFPGMVYISQPTEYGTLYSLDELKALSAVCREKNLPLYVDGARLAYALASPQNDVALENLAELADAFYIGGTKCGAYFGEAVVLRKNLIPHFFTIIKQRGALLAKGRILGVQFDTLFTDDLYFKIGRRAIEAADKIRGELKALGYELYIDAPTNQTLFEMTPAQMQTLSERV